jgi:glycosyltransferase involved in cell wall biosynthesis
VVGGAENYTKEISEGLTRRGHDVTVLAMHSSRESDYSGGDLLEVEVINGVKVNRFRPAGSLQGLAARLVGVAGVNRLFGLAVSRDAAEMFAASSYGVRPFFFSLRSNPDVVTVINWYDAWLACQASVACRVRDCAFVGIPLFHTETEWSRSERNAEILARCDAVVAMTEHEKEFIQERSRRDNACVVGVGVNRSVFAHADGGRVRVRYGIGDAPVVGYIGRMVPYKGVATVIEAMRTVWRADPRVRLLLAGSHPRARPDVKDEIGEALARLSDVERSRIVSVGGFEESEKGSLFDALDVFAMPSRAESFGISYLEAWLCKKAVIGARAASTECVIEEGVDGLLVAPRDPEDLATAILRLLSDRATRERMGTAGYAKTVARFAWDAITDKVESVYQEARATRLRQGSAASTASRSRIGRA